MFQPQLLIPPLIALLGLAFLLSATMRRFQDTRYEQVVFGLLFGGAVSLGMFNPLTLGEGFIFDTRTVLLVTAIVYAGPVAGTITLAFGVISRVIIGGAGMATGLLGLVLAFAIALLWLRYMRHRIANPYVHDLLLGMVMNLTFVALFLLPFDVATAILTAVWPKLLITNAVGAIAIGFVFRREHSFYSETRQMGAHASHDQLTTILNRRGFGSKVGALTPHASQGQAVFYFDIDDFKHINDTYGHDAGDAALAILAARIKETLREDSVFARQGGDEFSIYLHDIESGDVARVARRICAVISDQSFVHGEVTFPVTISLGGYWTNRPLSLEGLIQKADAQLLLAKRAGKNRPQIAYDRDFKAASVA